MYAYFPYQFEYQPQVHLRTDYPPHQSYPYSQYQDHAQQGFQYHNQNQPSSHQQLYQPVSTPSTTIDTPTSAYLTCATTTNSASTSTTTNSSISYYTPPQPEMVFTDPLIRPHDDNDNDNGHDRDANAAAEEGYYTYDHEYKWTEDQSLQQRQSHEQPVRPYLLQSQQQQQNLPSAPAAYPPSHSTSPTSSSSQQILPASPPQHSSERPSRASQVPPPRLTIPARREREQPFRAFHPYANARPAGAGQKEKDERRMDGEEKSVGSLPISKSKSTMPSSSPPPAHTAVSAAQGVQPEKPVETTTPTPDSASGSNFSSNTAKTPHVPVSPVPSSSHTHSTVRTTPPTTQSHESPTPTPIFGLFGSYPLSRGQALPGPTCAPETSSGVMRLAIAPGALAPVGSGSGHSGKKEKGEKATSVAVLDLNTAMPLSVNVNMAMTSALEFPASASNNPAFLLSATHTLNALEAPTSGVPDNFNTPTPGLNGAPNSSSNAMAMRKPRMACYFCRKRKIACGPGPVALALAQQAQAQAQAHHQQNTLGGGDLPSELTSTDDQDLKSKLPVESDGLSSSPISPSSSSHMSPMMSTLTPAQMQGQSHIQPSLQTLTGDEGPCNQCARRGLACERPTESKRGVRKGKSKKEKEKEAKEKEAKEKEMKKSEGTEKDDKEKDEDKDLSDEEGDVDDDMHDDLDGDGDADLDQDDGGDGDEKTIIGKTLAVSESVPSTSTSSTEPTNTAPKSNSKSTISSSSSNVTQKPPNRGRGRPPKHLSKSSADHFPSTPVANSSKSVLKSMTGSFKWSTSTAGSKIKSKATGKGKGKGKGKRKDVEVVAEAVPVTNAGDIKSEENKTGEDLSMEDIQEDQKRESEISAQGEKLDDAESDDEMLDDENDQQNEVNVVGEVRNDENATRGSFDAGYYNSPTVVMDSDMQHQVQAQPSSLPHDSPSTSSSIMPSGPTNSRDTISSATDSRSNIQTSMPAEITVPYPDAYSYYNHSYSHSPSPIVERQQQQHTFQHKYTDEDGSAENTVTQSTFYTHADINMQTGNDRVYPDYTHHRTAPPVPHSHDEMYAIGYSMPQAHGQAMLVIHPSANNSVGMQSYPVPVENPYNMGVETEVVAVQQQMPFTEGYDMRAADGYPMQSTTAMGYDQNTQTQGYVGVGYESYEYGYGYHMQYAA